MKSNALEELQKTLARIDAVQARRHPYAGSAKSAGASPFQKPYMKANRKLPNGIYYIVLGDLVGSTKFAAKWGDAAFTARIQTFVNAAKQAITNAKLSSNSGRFVKFVGDAVLIVFTHFPDIVQWQMEFDGTLQLIAAQQERFQVRFCVHAGELRFQGKEPLNLATSQLFKMEKEANAGEVVVSDVAYQLALPSLYPKQCIFEPNGAVRVDGYNRPLKLHRLVVKADIAFLIAKTGSSHGSFGKAKCPT
jgi:class 3 adenylate cyclase